MKVTKILAVVLVLLAVVLAALAWFVGRQPAHPRTPPQAVAAKAADVATKAVVVAARAVPAGQALVAEDLAVAELPAATADVFARPDELTGRVSAVPLAPGAPVFGQQLVSGLATQLLAGERAVAMKVAEESAAGNRIAPGDFVDVFLVLDERGGAAAGRSPASTPAQQARLLLAKKRVLAFGSRAVGEPDAASTAADGKPAAAASRPAQQPARTAVLALPVDEVDRLALAEQYGHLVLALRRPDDPEVPDDTRFAALPPLLQPRPVPGASPAGTVELAGADRAYAGLALDTLARGGATAGGRSARTPVRPAAEPSSAPARVPAGQRVEVLRGGALAVERY